jgi:thymidylate kinase
VRNTHVCGQGTRARAVLRPKPRRPLFDALNAAPFVTSSRAELLSLLAQGETLVVDRYSYSGVAYTAAKGVPHLSMEYLKSLEVGFSCVHIRLALFQLVCRLGGIAA